MSLRPPNLPTVSLCMICKNEEENLANCLDSIASHVDEIIIVDTGSTDKTREVAAKYGANIYQFDQINHPEAFFLDDEATNKTFDGPPAYSDAWALGDFGAARQESFSHATSDYIIWADADDVVIGAEHIRMLAGVLRERDISFGFVKYEYAYDDKGRCFYSQWRERLIKRGSATWVNPVHEVLIPNGAVANMQLGDMVFSHRRKADRPGVPHRNLKILLRQVHQLKSANPEAAIDPRILFYLGQEMRFVDARKAVGFYEEYLATSGWPEERAAAHCAIGMLLEGGALGINQAQAYQQANREYGIAAMEKPDNPDGLFGLARIAYLRGRYQDCVNYTERGFAIGNTDSMLGMNPMDRLYRPHAYYNHALSLLGRVKEAIESCKAALAVMPDDPGVPGGASGMLTNNLKSYERHLMTEQAKPVSDKPMMLLDKNEDVDQPPAGNIPKDVMLVWAMQLWKQNIAAGDIPRAAALLQTLPTSILTDPVIAKMQASTARRLTGEIVSVAKAVVRNHESSDVVFYLGPGVEPWDPTTPNAQGLGGSETAAIEMARELTKLGRKVIVYAEAEGIFDGVRYCHHSKFAGVTCEVFIASRVPWAIEQLGPVNAKVKLLWVHDIHCGPTSPQMERWLYQFDRVLCLSEWHKEFFCQCYPTLHPDQVIVTRNGIDPARFSVVVPKENRMVFSSSPNRGLPNLLLAMPALREKVPDVHLDIFYGFDTWKTMAQRNNNQPELQQIAQYEAQIAEAVKAGGVTWHGRQSQKLLADAFLRAKVWSYPTQFPETYGISALEAQAAGALPVTSRFAALATTVRYGVLLDMAPDYMDRWIENVVRAMTDEPWRAEIADKGRAWALTQTWAALAGDWNEMFGWLAKSVSADPIPQWRSA